MATLDLDVEGNLLHPRTGEAVTPADVKDVLDEHLWLDKRTTDIFLHVHGWRTGPTDAAGRARRLNVLVHDVYEANSGNYVGLENFSAQFVCVRWPSASKTGLGGYRKIRERAALMSTRGQAAHVLAVMLGYLNEERELPRAGPDTLRTASGQYLHCVGHSFGGRFLSHAIIEASARLREAREEPDVLSWPWTSDAYRWTADSLTVFQMAVPADAFAAAPYAELLSESVLNAPVVMTFSPHDRALGLWHRQAEGGRNGIGFLGATAPADDIRTLQLLDVNTPYRFPDPPVRLINVDARAYYRASLRFEGAHSDYFRPQSAHLLLSLAARAR
jgi:hypothetical protein